MEGDEGVELLAANGKEHHGLEPEPDNVPWTNFDGEHVAEYWDLEEVGLLNFMCVFYSLPSCPM